MSRVFPLCGSVIVLDGLPIADIPAAVVLVQTSLLGHQNSPLGEFVRTRSCVVLLCSRRGVRSSHSSRVIPSDTACVFPVGTPGWDQLFETSCSVQRPKTP